MIYEKTDILVDYAKAGLSAEGCKATLTCYAYDVTEETGPKSALQSSSAPAAAMITALKERLNL